MRYVIKGKQNNSKNCIVCGLENSLGLKTRFYETEGGELIALVTPQKEHQGYPNRLHGGMTSALLDETIGRVIMTRSEEQVWGVTVELRVRYKKPIPLGQSLTVIGRITSERGAIFEGSGELLLPDGQVAATATGKFMKLPLSQLASEDFDKEEWFSIPDEEELRIIETP